MPDPINSFSQHDSDETGPLCNDDQPTTVVAQQLDVINQPTMAAPRVMPTARPDDIGAPSTDEWDAQEKPKPRKTHKAFIALGVVLGIITLAYGGGVFAFSNVCYPNTTIADTDVSLMTRDTAAQRVRAAINRYELTVEGDGFSWTFTPESTSDIYDSEQAVDHLIKANEPWIWPVRLVRALQSTTSDNKASGSEHEETAVEDIDLPDTFDRESFRADLSSAIDAFNADRTGTFDAAGVFDQELNAFSLDKAHSNQKLDVNTVERDALVAISQLNKSVKIDGESYLPLVEGATDEQLQTAIDEANKLIGMKIELKLAGALVATLDGGTLAQWLTFDDNLKPTLATNHVSTWVGDLAKAKLDTVGSARSYRRPDGKEVRVAGGTYGWVCDEVALIKQMQDAVASGTSCTIDVPAKQKAARFTDAGQADWDAYIDIDLTEQYARYYDASGNVVWESNIISGNPNTDHATPTGIYLLNSKSRDMTLIGLDEDDDGEPDYKTPVSYWMPFVGNAVGLHDADWQASTAFSDPTAHTRQGSHGCVNLPPAKASELFEIIPVGVCVISHY